MSDQARPEPRQADLERLLMETTRAACRQQMLSFAKIMRDLLLAKKVPPAVLNAAIREAFDEYKDLGGLPEEAFSALLREIYLYGQPEGLADDPLGMILAEHGLRSGGTHRLLHPAGSPKDKAAREAYVKGAVPWPLVRYLLIGVRGTVPHFDPFDSTPLLFGPHNEQLIGLADRAREMADAHRVRFADGRTVVDWQTLYARPECLVLAREFIAFVLKGLDVLGPQRLQNILENLRHRDIQAGNEDALRRQIPEDDAAQLVRGLKTALTRLEKVPGQDKPAPAPRAAARAASPKTPAR
ncbi:hypothetical protein dsx2_0981 [Desulfovibrio sp. X2]|uniref:hypothetical protein n=1 Tax=Desulfovibrio sp. X2 TaxID=941449 RepID=UPI000358A209|nr:hypothetical protein [Desulfovibrio sp. X2]EPR37038.1 hypothetical protein dsx2_0981 [Desulfovibrio sp. X2]